MSITGCALLLVAASQHFGNKIDYEEIHPAFGVTCDASPIGAFSTGYFRNSQGDDTVWAAKRQYLTTGWTRYGQAYWELGFAAGYSSAPIVPIARLGYAVVTDHRVGVELFIAPGYERINREEDYFILIGAQLTVR